MNTLLTLIFVMALLSLGLSVYLFLNRDKKKISLTFRVCFEILTAGLLVESVLANVLLEFGCFGVTKLLLSSLFIAAILASVMRGFPRIVLALKLDRPMLWLILILVVASFFRFPPSNWIRGARDEGLYPNIANNIARTGKIFIKDKVLDEIKYNDDIRKYYLKNTYYDTGQAVHGKYEGAYTPGIYVKNISEGVLVPQFYHLQPIWFAISNILFGEEHTTLPLPLFGLLGIVYIYLIGKDLFESDKAGLLSATVLAVNPLHSYMSKFPVTEVTAGAFMLSGLYYLIRLADTDDRSLFYPMMAIFSFGCFFLTRMSGFLFLPPVILSMFYFRIFENDRAKSTRIIFTLWGIVVFYVYSFIHGYIFSFPYVHDNFNKFLDTNKFSASAIFVVALSSTAFLLVSLYYVGRLEKQAAVIREWFVKHSRVLILGSMCLLFLLMAYRGYLFAFTNKLVSHRWHPVAGGLKDLVLLNISVLAIMLTPVGLVLSFYGIYRILKDWYRYKKYFVIGLFSIYFLAVYTIIKVYTPILYYFARYLLSELIPLLIICLSFSLLLIAKKHSKTFVIVLLLVLVPSIGLSYLHTRGVGMKETYRDLKDINSLFNENSIIFIDKAIQPSYIKLVAPLKLTFNEKIFAFNKEDLITGKLTNIFRFFLSRNYNLFLVSNEDNLGNRYFYPIAKMPIDLNAMLVKKWSIPVAYSGEHRIVTIYGEKPDITELLKRSFDEESLRSDGFSYTMRVPNSFNTEGLVLEAGQVQDIPILLRNTSGETWHYRGRFEIHLAYHWCDNSGKVLIFDGMRSWLPYDIEPGEEVLISAHVKAPLEKGRYILEFDMVQEHVAWFKQRGAKTFSFPVMVKWRR